MSKKMRMKTVCLSLMCVVCVLSAGIVRAEIPLTFYASFDKGLKADYSLGKAEPFSLGFYLRRVEGFKGNAIDVVPKDFVRFSTKNNLCMGACTIKVWVKLNWTPPFYRQAFGDNVQCIWMTGHRRYPNYIAVKIEQPKVTNPNMLGRLTLRIANDKGKMLLSYPLIGWERGKWREIVVTWKRPGRIKWYLDGKVIGEKNDAPIPELSSEDMKDIYFGTNVNQSAYARLDNFDGAIDEVQIFRGFDVKASLESVKAFVKSHTKQKLVKLPKLKWVGRDRYRVIVAVGRSKGKWKSVPVKMTLDFAENLRRLGVKGSKVNHQSVRLVKYSLVTGEPVVYDEKYDDERRYYRPFVMDEEFWWGDKGVIRWIDDRPGKSSVYVIYFDTRDVYESSFPEEIPMIGNGDRLRVGRKGAVGRLAVGAWGDLDVYDFDNDGDYDVLIASGFLTRCNDGLQNGYYYYENVGKDRKGRYLFASQRRVGRAYGNSRWGVLHGTSVPQIVDWNNDGKEDLLVVGHWTQVWGEMSWDNVWRRPIVTKWHWVDMGLGYRLARLERARLVDWNGDGLNEIVADTHIYSNLGTNEEPRFNYTEKRPIWVDGRQIDVSLINGFRPLPVDFDGDGDMDLIFGGMLHWLMYFENVGTRTKPMLTYRGILKTYKGKELNIPGELIIPVAVDFDDDGDVDLLWGNENGNIGFNENIAGAHKRPKLKQTVFFQQRNPFLDSGTIVIPVVFDWDGDGDYDIITGASDQYILFYENVGSNNKPVWREGVPLKAGGKVIELIAGPDGSVQGRYEGHWGYNNPEIADWDGDGLADLIISNIRGEHIFFKNVGTRTKPKLAKGKKIKVYWGKEIPKYPEWLTFKPEKDTLVTVWRCRPVAIDWNKDGLVDYVALDYDGQLALYLRKKLPDGRLVLLPGKRIFKWDLGASRLMIWNRKPGAVKGASGRTVLNIVDWDGDGDYDLITDGLNARLFENITNNEKPHFVDRGDLVEERLVNHNTGPYVVDWDNDGKYDLLIGAEDGHMYYFNRAYIENDCPKVIYCKAERNEN